MQDTVKQTCCQNMKRDTYTYVHTHEAWQPFPTVYSCTHIWMTTPPPIAYPITLFLSPPRIYAHGLKSEFKPTGLKYGPIFSIREIYMIPS